MKRNRVILLGIAVLLVFGCSVLSPDRAAAEPTVLKATGAWPQTSPFTTIYFRFFDLVKERSQGRLQIRWVGGPEYVKEKDFSTAGQAGTIDVMQTCVGYHGGRVPAAGIADAYPLFRSYKTESAAYYETRRIVGPLLEKELKIKPIGCTQVFPFYLWTKEPLKSMADLKGMKIRGHGGYVPFIVKALGATPVTTPSTEVYIALERGIIDGAVRNLPALNSFKEYELTRYGISTPVTWATGDICISLRAWDKLSDEFQKILLEAGKDATRQAVDFWEKKDQALMGKFPQQNVVFFDLPEDEKRAFLEAVEKGANEAAHKLSPKYAESIIQAFKKTGE
ncbi:MAG: TRAP transporter substrate-binding protein [Desulfatiglandales bacterium]